AEFGDGASPAQTEAHGTGDPPVTSSDLNLKNTGEAPVPQSILELLVHEVPVFRVDVFQRKILVRELWVYLDVLQIGRADRRFRRIHRCDPPRHVRLAVKPDVDRFELPREARSGFWDQLDVNRPRWIIFARGVDL